jgi:ATP-dependent RNA helicase RhlE
MTKTTNKNSGFADLGISPKILSQLQKLNFTEPTPIQHQAIPIAISGQDLMGIAQTGTGKTLAFGIPMLQHLEDSQNTGLILLPTRELATQVDQSLRVLGRGFGLRTAILIGGTPPGPQIKALKNKPHIIIATPGRLIDHLEHGTVVLKTVKILVLDEADRMLDMGFEPQIQKILATVPSSQRQTMLFSATMPEKITRMAQKYMRSPLRVEVAPAGTTAKNITQEMFIVPKDKKLSLLNQILSECTERVLIFSRTKHGARKITKAVQNLGHKAAEIHSNRSLAQRAKALKDFKSGFTKILVATDIASRGIDVQDIKLVINFDLPDNNEDYVHRIGRTARAGKSGKAISFAMPDQKGDIKAIERLVRVKLPITPLPEMKEHIAMPRDDRRSRWSGPQTRQPRTNTNTKNYRRSPAKRRRRNND